MNPDEFRQYYFEEPGFMFSMTKRTETIRTSRKFSDVYRTLEDRVPACLDVRLRSHYVPQSGVSVIDLIPKVRRIDQRTALVTIQMPGGVGATMPDDGAYFFLLDLKSVPQGTDAMLYGRKSDKKIFDAFERWITGIDLSCPKLSTSSF
jgi:hypothetical protein